MWLKVKDFIHRVGLVLVYPGRLISRILHCVFFFVILNNNEFLGSIYAYVCVSV